jgi:NodT family efflux transporter outer membrane factor (OMF) lipoprotein
VRLEPLLLTLLLASPAVAAPGAGATVPNAPAAWSVGSDGEIPIDPWWDRLSEPALADAIRVALSGNLDLASATDRVDQARALALQGLSPMLPSLSFDYSIAGETDDVRAGRTGFLTPDVLPDFVYSGSGQLTAALELDLFGRNVLGYQAARNDLLASRGDRAAIASTVAARVAAAWFDVALATERLTALEAQLQAGREVLEITKIRQARAEATAVEVLQQQQTLAATEAQLPLIRLARRVAVQQLAVLMGRSPTDPPDPLPTQMPDLPGRGGLGSPEDLLESRSDLRAAADRLSSAWQRRIARERAFLPRIRGNFNLTGAYSNTQRITFGLAGAEVEYGSVYGWTVGGSLSWPIFDGGLSIAQLQGARAQERAAAHALGAAMLNATAQVEGSIAQDEEQTERLAAVRRQAEAARQAFAVARERYGVGVGDYLTVLSTLNAWQTSELSLLQARRDALAARVSLHDAVGGAWTRTLESTP